MNRVKKRSRRGSGFLVLAMLSGGLMHQAFCSAIDIRHNLVAGTMDFIAGYAEDFLAALIPPPEELLGRE